MRAFLVAASVALAAAQDPADGWMAYAVGTVPAGTQRITRLEMQWKVGANPNPSSAFYSPWFGMVSTNLHMLLVKEGGPLCMSPMRA